MEHRDGPQLTFEGFDHLDKEVKLLKDFPFHHLFAHAEVAHAGHGESPRCSPQLPDGEEDTWGGHETSLLAPCTEVPHHTKQDMELDEAGSPQVFVLPSF